MDANAFLADMSKDFDTLRGLILKAVEQDIDPGVREHLMDLHGALGKSLADVKEAMPAAEAARTAELDGLQASNERLKGELDELERKIQQVEAAAAAPPPPPAAPPAYDPRLGKTLRDELVGRFGPKRPAGVPAAAIQGDVADVASSEFVSQERAPTPPAPPQAAPAPKAPAPPTPPSKGPKPKPKKQSDDSGEWTRDS